MASLCNSHILNVSKGTYLRKLFGVNCVKCFSCPVNVVHVNNDCSGAGASNSALLRNGQKLQTGSSCLTERNILQVVVAFFSQNLGRLNGSRDFELIHSGFGSKSINFGSVPANPWSTKSTNFCLNNTYVTARRNFSSKNAENPKPKVNKNEKTKPKGKLKKSINTESCNQNPKVGGGIKKDSNSPVLKVSSLHVPDHLRSKFHSALDPYLNFDKTFENLEVLASDLEKRGLRYTKPFGKLETLGSDLEPKSSSAWKIVDKDAQRYSDENLQEMKGNWEAYKNLTSKEFEIESRSQKLTVEQSQLKEMTKTEQIERRIKEIKLELIPQIRKEMKKLKPSLGRLEETFLPKLLGLPNTISESTPIDEDQVVLEVFDKPKFNFKPKSHVQIGLKNKTIEFSDVCPGGFYLLDDLAVAELSIEDLFIDRFFKHEFLQQSNPDFGKGVSVEGCGLDIHDPSQFLKMIYHNADKDRNPQFLMGGASLPSFTGYFAKKIVKKIEKFLPQKIVSVGRKYKALPRRSGLHYGESRLDPKGGGFGVQSGEDFVENDTCPNAGIFSSMQSTCISAFVAYQKPNQKAQIENHEDGSNKISKTANGEIDREGKDGIFITNEESNLISETCPNPDIGHEPNYKTSINDAIVRNENAFPSETEEDFEDEIVNNLLSAMTEAYAALGVHFRIVQKSAKNLKRFERAALSVEMITTVDFCTESNKTLNENPAGSSNSSHVRKRFECVDPAGEFRSTLPLSTESDTSETTSEDQYPSGRYTEIGRISIIGDYVSKRLLMAYSEDEAPQLLGRLKFLDVVYADVVDVSKLVAVLVENKQDETLGYTLPDVLQR